MGEFKRVLYLGSVWPETNASASGLRNWSLVEAFRRFGWEVLYASDAKDNPFKSRLSELGTRAETVQPNDPAFDQLLREFQPDLVLFDRFMIEEKFGWRVREQCPGALRVLDTVDLHFLRRQRQKEFFPKESIEGERERELAAIYRSDLTLVVSDFEQRYLAELGVPAALVDRCSLFYKEPPVQTPAREDRQHFSFIGNFRHSPNADGVRWLKQEIWPLIQRELPGIEMHVYGAYPAKEHMDLGNARERFKVLGPAADQYETLRNYRVTLAPVRFGAGVKGKICDSWWCGTPVVSTPVGAEGMGEKESQWGGIIAASPTEFAAAAIRLYKEEDLWTQAQIHGRKILAEYFDERLQSERLLKRLVSIRNDLHEHRARNVVGSLLWHHAHQSTLYFSKWIESKRKLAPGLQN